MPLTAAPARPAAPRLQPPAAPGWAESFARLAPFAPAVPIPIAVRLYPWHAHAAQQAGEAACLAAGTAHLPILLHARRAAIGPLRIPGDDAPCIRCHQLWTGNDWSNRLAETAETPLPPVPPARRLAIAAAALAVAAERPAGEVRLAAWDPPATTRHRLQRHPDCDGCPPLPPDAPSAPLRAAPAAPLRALSLATLRRRIEPLARDPHCGMVRGVSEDTASLPLPMAFAALHAAARPTDVEVGVGRAGARAADRAVALLEAVERFAGLRPRGRRTVVRASFAELGGDAVDPRDFILHDETQRAEPGFTLLPFDENRPQRWVHAWSARRDAPALIPEQLAYYGRPAPGQPADPRFVYEVSNGCSVGASPAEAAFHGLVELVERDAFLASWYAGRPLPRLALDDIGDPFARALRHRLLADGFELDAVDLRAGLALPAVGVMLRDPVPGRGPPLRVAAGAHPDPEKAFAGALVEAATAVTASAAPERQAAMARRAATLIEDPSLVQAMADHIDQCWHPDAAARRGFALSATAVPPAAPAPPRPAPLAERLHALMADMLTVASDLLFVDQSFEPYAAAGVHCVKALAPGLLPMTFGNQHRRICPRRMNRLRPWTADDQAAARLRPHAFP